MSIESILLWPFESLSTPQLAGVVALLVGLISGALTKRDLRDCGAVPGRWPLLFGIIGGALAAAFTVALFDIRCQQIDIVRPGVFWFYYRLPFHLMLITLLVTITATDLKTCYILDRTNLVGLLLGVGGATISGDLQIEHIWVDWSQEIPQIQGPYIPEWVSRHPHWHGLVWSLTGACAGAGLTWLVQFLSGLILARPALGTGDIFLMAMIGSFLGWQPTLVAFAIAPLLAVGIGVLVRLVHQQAIIPYGPFLAGGAILVLFSWRWIHFAQFRLTDVDTEDPRQVFALRRFLGDPVSLSLVFGGAFVLFLVLLGALRWYRSSGTARVDRP